MAPPRVELACGTHDCFVFDAGRGRLRLGLSCAHVYRGSVGASAGTLLSLGGPRLELPRAGRPRSLESPCSFARCML